MRVLMQLQQMRSMGGEWRRAQDHFAKQAKKLGMRSRASFKLQQMQDKAKILRKGMSVVELGAAPGGWSVVLVDLVGGDKSVPWDRDNPPVRGNPPTKGPVPAASPAGGSEALQSKGEFGWLNSPVTAQKRRIRHGVVVCCDLLEMPPVPGATFVRGDFQSGAVQDKVRSLLPRGQADVVLSDMAPNTSGSKEQDHDRIVDLCMSTLSFAEGGVLRPGGKLLVKLFNGAGMDDFRGSLRDAGFGAVKILKPEASRSASSEMYVLATGYVPKAGGSTAEVGDSGDSAAEEGQRPLRNH